MGFFTRDIKKMDDLFVHSRNLHQASSAWSATTTR